MNKLQYLESIIHCNLPVERMQGVGSCLIFNIKYSTIAFNMILDKTDMLSFDMLKTQTLICNT